MSIMLSFLFFSYIFSNKFLSCFTQVLFSLFSYIYLSRFFFRFYLVRDDFFFQGALVALRFILLYQFIKLLALKVYFFIESHYVFNIYFYKWSLGQWCNFFFAAYHNMKLFLWVLSFWVLSFL